MVSELSQAGASATVQLTGRNTLDTATTGETSDGGLGNTLDVVTKNLAVALGTALAETLSALATCGKCTLATRNSEADDCVFVEQLVRLDAVACGVEYKTRLGAVVCRPTTTTTTTNTDPKGGGDDGCRRNTTTKATRFEDGDEAKRMFTYVQSSWMKLMKKSVMLS